MLVLFGTKRLWLYPPSDTPYIYPVRTVDSPSSKPGDITSTAGGSSRSIAPPFKRLDELAPEVQASFPLLQGVRPVEVLLEAGDALYLPAFWWHCVEGSAGRNMILSWWSRMHPSKEALA